MGQKYAIFDDKGFPKAFYDDEIHENIPQEAIEITEEQWLEFINNQGRRKWDFNTNQVVPLDPDSLLTLDDWKVRLKNQVKNLRKQKETEGIIVIGSGGTNQYKFDTSLTGRANTQGVLNSFQMRFLDPATDTVHWKFMDDKFADLTYDQLKELAGFALHYIESLFQAESAHYQTIDALTTVDEAKAYDVANWPSNQYQSQLVS